MARKARIEFEGAFYHVIARGNQRQKIFKDPEDCRCYLDILTDYKKRYHYTLHAYVLMNNHVHLLIETKEVPLSKILQGINQRYTMYFNRKYRTFGHLFQGRYKALLCNKDAYLLSLVKYIHMNPMRAKVVKMAEDYPWNSHLTYAKKDRGGELVDSESVLRMFSDDANAARRLYRAFMGDGITIKKEDIYQSVEQRIVGDERFVDEVKAHCDLKLEGKKRQRQYSLDEIAAVIRRYLGATIEQMRRKGKERKVALARKLYSLIAKEYGYKGTEISGYLRKDPAVITRYLKAKAELAGDLERCFDIIGRNVNTQV